MAVIPGEMKNSAYAKIGGGGGGGGGGEGQRRCIMGNVQVANID